MLYFPLSTYNTNRLVQAHVARYVILRAPRGTSISHTAETGRRELEPRLRADSPSMSPRVNSSPNSAKVGSMFSMVEMNSPVSIASVRTSLSPEGRGRSGGGGRKKQEPQTVRYRPQHLYPPGRIGLVPKNRETTPEPHERRTTTSIN